MFPVIGDSHQWQYDIESFVFCDGWGSLGGNIVNTDWLPDEKQPSEFVIPDQKGTKIAQGKFQDYPFMINMAAETRQPVISGSPCISHYRKERHISTCI